MLVEEAREGTGYGNPAEASTLAWQPQEDVRTPDDMAAWAFGD